MGLATFRLYLGTPGAARSVIINDEDVGAIVHEVQVRAPAGGIPEVWLRMPAEGTIEGEGIVRVTSDEDGDVGEVVAAFLESVDPAQLEADSLEGLGLGDEGPTKAMLAKLVEYARGRP